MEWMCHVGLVSLIHPPCHTDKSTNRRRWGTYSTSEAVNAGLDLEMPGATKWRGEMLVQAVGVNKVAEYVLDERVRNVLNLVNKCAAAKIPEHAEETTADTPETAAFLRKIGGESIVLMKNEGDILPLKKDKKVSSSNTYFVSAIS